MFKRKNQEKTIDLNKDIETIQTHKPDKSKGSLPSNSTPNPNDQHQTKGDDLRPLMRYGLIEKQLPKPPQKPKEQNLLVKLYIKKRMQEIQAKQKQQSDTTATQILQMQKQYLSAAESKITEYDVKQIHKKIEKVATESIKSQLEHRKSYLVELLQSEHEKMEYASKKELKMIKQDRERLEKELSSKYKSEGRRHFVEYIKQSNISGGA